MFGDATKVEIPSVFQAPAENPLQRLRRELKAAILERDEEIDGVLTALLAKEHVLLVGPPGIAKTLIATTVCNAIVGGRLFALLMTRFTGPEEVFGPFKLSALSEDRYERKTDGYLPGCTVTLLDEVYKANSAILNSLLTIINERRFDNGGVRIPVPLDTIIAASNELPQDAALEALHDRLMLRYVVSPLSRTGSDLLIDWSATGVRPQVTARIHLKGLQDTVPQVVVPNAVSFTIKRFRDHLLSQGITLTDRRWDKSVSLVRARAVLEGRSEACATDVGLLWAIAWKTPDQIPHVRLAAITAVREGMQREQSPQQAGGGITLGTQIAQLRHRIRSCLATSMTTATRLDIANNVVLLASLVGQYKAQPARSSELSEVALHEIELEIVRWKRDLLAS